MPTQRLKDLLIVLQEIDQSTKAGGFLENELS